MYRLFVAAAAAAFAALPANAAVLTFNSAGAVGQVLGNNIVENGFRISADQCANNNCFTVRGAPTAGTGSDGRVLEAYAFNPAITISQVNNAAFTLQSFALTGVELPFAFQSNFDVLFGFNYADGTSAVLATSIDANYTTPTSYLIQSQIAGYTTKALTSFYVKADFDSQAGAKLQLDNINVTPVAAAVPEPTTWAMIIGGFGVIGGAMRKRRRNVGSSFA
jgi:hypothetical protein